MSAENPRGKGAAESSTDATDKTFSCDECGSEHDTQTGLSIHESKAHGGPVDGNGVDCPGCDRSYSCQRGLIEHLSGVNSCGGGHECSECGRTFPTKRGWRHHKKEVHGIDTRPVVECETCGDTRQIDPNHEKQSDMHFCGPSCYGKWASEHNSGPNNPQYKPRIQLECEMCGDKYTSPPHRPNSVVCSDSCRGAWMSKHYSGENAFRWKGGIVRFYGDNWQEQRRKAMRRDDYTCQSCGKDMSGDGRDPDVHHIKRLKWFQENYDKPEWWERGNKLDNLVCLCRPCHHRWEGVPIRPKLL